MVEQVDAHGFRRNLIFPDGFEGPAVGRVQQQCDEHIGNGRSQENVPHIVQGWDILDAQGPVGDAGGVGDDDADDLREA